MANKWSVVTTEKFDAIPDATKLDVREQLTHIKEKGVRVVLLSCTAGYVSKIMKQAKELEMIQGWAWIVMVSKNLGSEHHQSPSLSHQALVTKP